MLTVIGCDHCGNESNLNVSFTFTAQSECCEKCHHLRSTSKTFHFCDIECFTLWFDKVKGTGIPCWDCRGTGFSSGFESNGICTLCDGKKYLKESKMVGFAQ
jgi:hypothetical protein